VLRILHFIGGELVGPASGRWLEDWEPAAGRVLGELPDGDARDVEQAVEAAERAFPGWSNLPAAERSRILLRIADGIQSRLDSLAYDESVDTGKPIALARRVDIPRACANFRFFATAILHETTEAHVTDRIALNTTFRRPRGVAGAISPWNLPLYLLTWKIAPALATGNTVVAKPSELTPLTAFRLSEICQEAGLPAGVLNIVHGKGSKAGAALVSHPRVPAISFTGGTETGAAIAQVAGPLFKRVALELGGKNATIVFADCEFDTAVSEAVRASFENQGQLCLSGSRILVEESIYDRFLQSFLDRTRGLRLGDPLEPDTDQGALVSRAHQDKVLSAIERARREGGRILCGGGPPENLPDRCRHGWFVEPTVIADLPATSELHRQEIFGPVAIVVPFRDEDEAIAIANGTPYGLSGSVWTENLARAHRVADRLEAGTIWVNCWMLRDLRAPFGGMKQSGLGREGGQEALRFFTEPKNVCIRIPPGPGRS
jgi:aminomuconate-semialdehyde/2-hydroxymuconate-6-semialdehyde dehydrogenase